MQGRGDAIARRLIAPLAVAALVFGVLYLFYSPLRVSGESMEPTLRDTDRILRNKHAGTARRGDIVVIDVGTSAKTDDVVKRVVAVGGDYIEVRDDIPWVNGVPEERTDVIVDPSQGVDIAQRIVPKGTVFVMGDNRPVSLDSRFVGFVPVSDIRGKVVFILLPLSDFGRPK